jgi:hypothetical protein
LVHGHHHTHQLTEEETFMSTSELGLWPAFFVACILFQFTAQSQDDNPGDAFLQEREVAQADGLGRVRNWPTRIITQFSKIADEENWLISF